MQLTGLFGFGVHILTQYAANVQVKTHKHHIIQDDFCVDFMKQCLQMEAVLLREN